MLHLLFFLLSAKDQHDGDSWALRLLECQDRGLAPKTTIADFGTGIRAGQQRAMPEVPWRGDIFHALHALWPVVTFLENRAYATITTHDKLQHKKVKLPQQGRRDQRGQVQALGRKVGAAKEQDQAIALADEVAVLARWLRDDVFAVSALSYADRTALFDFLVAELATRVSLCPHRLAPVCTLLKNHRDQLLAFARQLDEEVTKLATDFEVPVAIVRALLDLQALDQGLPLRWQNQAVLQEHLGERFYPLEQTVIGLRQQVV